MVQTGFHGQYRQGVMGTVTARIVSKTGKIPVISLFFTVLLLFPVFLLDRVWPMVLLNITVFTGFPVLTDRQFRRINTPMVPRYWKWSRETTEITLNNGVLEVLYHQGPGGPQSIGYKVARIPE